MGSKTRLSSYCSKRGDNTVNLVTSRKTNTRLACPIDVIVRVELAWHSGSVMDCHTAAWGSIPGGNGVKNELLVLRKGE